jgi:hypothetical protein
MITKTDLAALTRGMAPAIRDFVNLAVATALNAEHRQLEASASKRQGDIEQQLRSLLMRVSRLERAAEKDR